MPSEFVRIQEEKFQAMLDCESTPTGLRRAFRFSQDVERACSSLEMSTCWTDAAISKYLSDSVENQSVERALLQNAASLASFVRSILSINQDIQSVNCDFEFLEDDQQVLLITSCFDVETGALKNIHYVANPKVQAVTI